jgi:hypothetical protein
LSGSVGDAIGFARVQSNDPIDEHSSDAKHDDRDDGSFLSGLVFFPPKVHHQVNPYFLCVCFFFVQSALRQLYTLVSNAADLQQWVDRRMEDRNVTSIAPMREYLRRIDCDVRRPRH